MIYEGLARVVTEAGRRRRLRSIISFLAEELAVENGTFEEEEALEEEGDSILAELVGDGEVAMMVEEAFIFSCLASLLFTIVWYRIMPNQSFNFMCWFN